MSYKDFTEMPVWQTAFKRAIRVYEITKHFPSEEKFGLVSDMRRAANSVTNNLAVGFSRYEKLDKTRFYKFSRGSCYKIKNQSLTSGTLNYTNETNKEELITGYKKVIEELDLMIKSIESRKNK